MEKKKPEEIRDLTDELLKLVKIQSKQLNEQSVQLELFQKREDALVSRVRRFLTSLPFGLVVLEKNQSIRAINQLASELFQYSDKELAGKPVSTVFPEVEMLDTNCQGIRLMARKKGGESLVTEVFVNDLEMSGEELLFVSVQDVNEKHRLEQLRKDLIGMVSHDLRIPLTAVRATLEMVHEGLYGPLNSRGAGLVLQAVTSVEYLNSLINNLLEAEKVESGTIELHCRETSIGELINRAVSTVSPPDRPVEVEIETEFTNDCITVDGDRIIQVLINLIANAIKYSPKDEKVTVTGGIEGVDAKFAVIDRGAGIPQEMQSVIFERYRQLNQPARAKKQGFGLGLAICKALVEKHKGHIWVESVEGKGSKFCFTVPMDA